MPEKIILTDSAEQTAKLFGDLDANLDKLESAFGVTIKSGDSVNTAGNALSISGGDLTSVERAADALGYLKRMTKLNDTLTEQNVDYVIRMVSDGRDNELSELDDDAIVASVLKGYVAATGDLYAEYFTAEEFKEQTSTQNGEMCGNEIVAVYEL